MDIKINNFACPPVRQNFGTTFIVLAVQFTSSLLGEVKMLNSGFVVRYIL